ncbi:MAG: hypothetical protein AB7E77_07140 [Desulfobulbus sp.]
MTKSNKRLVANLLFVAVGAGILYFLFAAPPETTKPLPHDGNHQRFMAMKKQEAEKFCESCHAADKEAPLPENHPPKFRCLFCHKRM